jgi:hypothetical protein
MCTTFARLWDKEKSLTCFRGTSLSSRHLRQCSLHVNTTGVCNQMHATSATRGAKKLPVTACMCTCMDVCTHTCMHQTGATASHPKHVANARASKQNAHRAVWCVRWLRVTWPTDGACERRCRSFVVPQHACSNLSSESQLIRQSFHLLVITYTLRT